MRTKSLGVMGVVAVLAAAGCRSMTQISEIPRVDMDLEGGNRGYLVGTPPDTGLLKMTRQMVETTIELPTRIGGKTSPLSAGESEPTAVSQAQDLWESGIATEAAPQAAGIADTVAADAPMDTYVVQKGDSLWSIAARPEIFGKASRWRALFDANRDVLKSPNDLKVGMSLKVPRTSSAGSTTYDDDGITVKK
jgi:LysM repeat protein